MFCSENHPDRRTGHQHHPPSQHGPCSIDKPSTNCIFTFHINVMAISTLHEIFSRILVHFTLDTYGSGSRRPFFQTVYTQVLRGVSRCNIATNHCHLAIQLLLAALNPQNCRLPRFKLKHQQSWLSMGCENFT